MLDTLSRTLRVCIANSNIKLLLRLLLLILVIRTLFVFAIYRNYCPCCSLYFDGLVPAIDYRPWCSFSVCTNDVYDP